MIFVVGKFEMLTVTGSPSSQSGKLEPETVIGARVSPEDSVIERGGSSESLMLAIGPFWSVLCRLSVFKEPASCSLWSISRTKELPMSTSELPTRVLIKAQVKV
jgi:hypothetical protein